MRVAVGNTCIEPIPTPDQAACPRHAIEYKLARVFLRNCSKPREDVALQPQCLAVHG